MYTRRWLGPLMVVMLLASALITPASYAQDAQPFGFKLQRSEVRNPPKGSRFVPGQILVRMRDGSQFATQSTGSASAIQAHFSSLNLRTATVIAPRTYRFSVDPQADVRALARQIAADPSVAYAQPNYLYAPLRLTNDPLASFQYAINKVNMAGAWDITTGSSNVTIAIIDTGITPDHPEFAGRVLPGYDFANNDADPRDDGEISHGTHVAGIAAAAGDNGQGIAGMCWQCKILPIKVFNSREEATDEWVSAGIRYAADQGARVINLSLGGYEEDDSPLLHDAIRYATQKNVLVVAAAGNAAEEGNPVSYPAAYDEVLAVGATDENDQRAYYSEVQPYVDVSAPGTNIPSTYDQGAFPPIPYLALSGTSMAAPYVAGLGGLLLSVNPSLDVNALRQIIVSTADDLGQPGGDWEFGAGRINAARAVAAVRIPAFDPAANPDQPDVAFFPETQHTLRGEFKRFWEENGGLAVFGFPISEEFQEATAEGTFAVQYFERNRFEFHPEKEPPYNVLLGRLSDVQLKRQGRDWFTFPKGQETAGCQFFAETGHSVCEPFLSYWKGNGLRDPQLPPDGRSLALFGLPLSEPQPEVNSSGENVVTQWFERARFEFHPDKPQPYQVLLGLLGNETARPGNSATPSSSQPAASRCEFLPPSVDVTISPTNCMVVATEVRIEAVNFKAGENVQFYVNLEDGQTVDLDPLKADGEGRIVLDRALMLFPAGVYTFVMEGAKSHHKSVLIVRIVDR